MSEGGEVRFDKPAYIIGAAAIAVGGVLGFLAAGRPGILAAFAGLIPPVLWQVVTDRHNKNKARREQLVQAARKFVPQQLSGGVARYLRPEAAIVTFWPRPELFTLHGWAASPLRADVQLVTGEGGAGKTRLALQFGGELHEQSEWRSYWVPAGGEASAAAAAGQGNTAVLLVLDYAETRTELGGILAQVITSSPRVKLRVLLLARSAGEWWQQLIFGTATIVSERLAAIAPITLGPLTDPSGQHTVYRQAMQAFAAEVGASCPDTPLPPSIGPGAPALVVHAAALLAVLEHEHHVAASVPASRADVIGGLLRHEERYWQQSQARYGLALGPVLARRAVAAGTLVGADDEESASRLLEAIGELADPGTRGRTVRWLHDLYPTEQITPAASEWIAPLRPDLVAENLVVGVLRDRPQLALRLLDGLSAQRAGRALTLLARAALTEPAARDLTGQVLACVFHAGRPTRG
jgi:hypothetical protein